MAATHNWMHRTWPKWNPNSKCLKLSEPGCCICLSTPNLCIFKYWFHFMTANSIPFHSNECWNNSFESFYFFVYPYLSHIVPHFYGSMLAFHEMIHPADKQHKMSKFFKITNFTIFLTNLLSINTFNFIL